MQALNQALQLHHNYVLSQKLNTNSNLNMVLPNKPHGPIYGSINKP